MEVLMEGKKMGLLKKHQQKHRHLIQEAECLVWNNFQSRWKFKRKNLIWELLQIKINIILDKDNKRIIIWWLQMQNKSKMAHKCSVIVLQKVQRYIEKALPNELYQTIILDHKNWNNG